MKRARDVREQLVGLMQRVEMELVSGITETINIRKVCIAQRIETIYAIIKWNMAKIVFRLLRLGTFIM